MVFPAQGRASGKGQSQASAFCPPIPPCPTQGPVSHPTASRFQPHLQLCSLSLLCYGMKEVLRFPEGPDLQRGRGIHPRGRRYFLSAGRGSAPTTKPPTTWALKPFRFKSLFRHELVGYLEQIALLLCASVSSLQNGVDKGTYLIGVRMRSK